LAAAEHCSKMNDTITSISSYKILQKLIETVTIVAMYQISQKQFFFNLKTSIAPKWLEIGPVLIDVFYLALILKYDGPILKHYIRR
jgi:hypothetical protein